jgi:hypothetical protein
VPESFEGEYELYERAVRLLEGGTRQQVTGEAAYKAKVGATQMGACGAYVASTIVHICCASMSVHAGHHAGASWLNQVVCQSGSDTSTPALNMMIRASSLEARWLTMLDSYQLDLCPRCCYCRCRLKCLWQKLQT